MLSQVTTRSCTKKNNIFLFQTNYNTLHQQLASNVKLDMDRKPELPILPPPLPPLKEEDLPFAPDQRLVADLEDTYDWSRQISEKGFVAAPVSLFKHVSIRNVLTQFWYKYFFCDLLLFNKIILYNFSLP